MLAYLPAQSLVPDSRFQTLIPDSGSWTRELAPVGSRQSRHCNRSIGLDPVMLQWIATLLIKTIAFPPVSLHAGVFIDDFEGALEA